jgi:hypothetical protein
MEKVRLRVVYSTHLRYNVEENKNKVIDGRTYYHLPHY